MKNCNARKARQANCRGRREKDQERNSEFDDEHHDRIASMNPRGEVVRVPAEPRRQWLGFEMEIQRRKMVPGGVTARQLDTPGIETSA